MKNLRESEPKTEETPQVPEPEQAQEPEPERQGEEIPPWRRDPFGNPIEVEEEVDLFEDKAGFLGGLGTGILAAVLVFFVNPATKSAWPIYAAVIAAAMLPQLFRRKLHWGIKHFTTWMLAGFVVIGLIAELLPRFLH